MKTAVISLNLWQTARQQPGRRIHSDWTHNHRSSSSSSNTKRADRGGAVQLSGVCVCVCVLLFKMDRILNYGPSPFNARGRGGVGGVDGPITA